MQEFKNINQLFEAAKSEPPKLTYEEVAQKFKASTVPTGILAKTKALFVNLNNLSILMSISIIFVVTFFLWSNSDMSKVAVAPAVQPIIDSEQHQAIDTETIVKPIAQLTVEVNKPQKELLNRSKVVRKNYFKKEEAESVDENLATATTPTESEIRSKSKTVTNTTTAPPAINRIKISDSMDTTDLLLTTPTTPIVQPTPTPSPELSIMNAKSSAILQLSKGDSKKAVADFVKAINSYGIQTKVLNNRRALGYIQKLSLQFRHRQGLDWRMKLQGFNLLEIKVLLDKQQQPYGVTYRLNQVGDFTDHLSLSHFGRSSHKFAKKRTKGRHQHIQQLRSN